MSSKQFSCNSSVKRTLYQKSWGSSRYFFFFWQKWDKPLSSVLVSSGLCLANLPWIPFLPSVLWRNHDVDLPWGKGAPQFFKYLSEFFFDLLGESLNHFGGILVGQPLLKLSAFVDNVSYNVSWSPKALEMALQLFSGRQISATLLLICSCDSLVRSSMCCFLKPF